jgi:hypothetical protein
MAQFIDNLTVENSIDAPLSTQVNSALSNKYDASNPSGFQTAAQVTTAANNAVTTANAFTTAQIASLVAASPATLDTLNEIATALGNDPNFAATQTTALASRLRVDTAAQGLSGTQKTNAKTNIDLQNVENTSDLNKAISTATQTALNLKYDASNPNNYETTTQLNTRDTNNRNRANHTGTQTASTISDFASSVASSVLSTVLTGISFATSSSILDTDSLLLAFGKLQAQINSLITSVSLKADNILTGLILTDFSLVSATDSVLQAIGKLQAQISKTRIQKTAANIVSGSNVTLSTISDLGFTVTAGRSYQILATILYQSANANTGIVLTAALTTAVGNLALSVQIPTLGDGTTANFNGTINASGDIVLSTGTPVANVNYCAVITGVFVCTTSGSIAPQFRSENNGTNITVLAGSFISVREL